MASGDVTGKVLVTGGSGFIGSHLVDRLVQDGPLVRVLDRIAPRGGADVDWTEADVRDLPSVERAARGASVIVHLASIVGVDALMEDPGEVIDIAVSGTRTVLEAARNASIPVVHLSTSEVLGSNPAVPWAEDADRVLGSSLTDRWSYGVAKAAAEHIVLTSGRSGGMPVTVVRPFNVYGPRQEPRFVIPKMVRAALRGEPLIIDDGGTQTRCFTYVDDLIDGLVRVIAAPGRVPILHLGSEVETSILELANLIQSTTGTSSGVAHRSTEDRWGGRMADVPRRVPDASLARAVFGWEASTPLAEGTARLVTWLRADGSWRDEMPVAPGI